ncbi:MAG: SDR family oxidoreductase [Pseudomonadota bacterium]
MTASTAKTLLITGASSGIGAQTARQAVKAGWKVALVARRADKLDDVVRELGNDNALALSCDVQSFEDQTAAVKRTLDTFGRLDAVFANAGRGGGPGGYSEGDPAMWRDLILTNIYGLALTIRASAAALKASNGSLIITSSIAGRRTIPGSVYGMTKWAATAIGNNVREEFAGAGVRVTLIEPGMVDTPFFDEAKPNALKPEDVAATVMFALDMPARGNINELVVVPTNR